MNRAKNKLLLESVPSGKVLLEDAYWMEYILEEGKEGKTPKLVGKFGQTGVPTANGRVYTEAVMRREIDRLSETAMQGGLFGTLDHPKDGKTRLVEVSHLIKNMEITEKGEIRGSIHLIPGTTGGDAAIAIARVGGKLGISSRGVGTAIPDENGNHIVQEDFRLISFDIVADPANAGAHPNFVIESVEDTMKITLSELKTSNVNLYNELMAEARKEVTADVERQARDDASAALERKFENQMEEAAEEIKTAALEEAKEALLNDPMVAGAVKAMESIRAIVAPFIMSEDENNEIAALVDQVKEGARKLAEADDAYRKLDAEAKEVTEIAKELGFRIFIDKELSECDDSEKVYEMLGDLKKYDSVDEVKDKIDAVLAIIDEESRKAIEKDEEINKLKDSIAKLKEDKQKYLELSNKLSARVYAESKLGMRPDRENILELIEERNISTVAEIDNLIKSQTKVKPSEEYLAIRRGLKEDTDEGGKRPLTESSGNQFGQALDDLVNGIV